MAPVLFDVGRCRVVPAAQAQVKVVLKFERILGQGHVRIGIGEDATVGVGWAGHAECAGQRACEDGGSFHGKFLPWIPRSRNARARIDAISHLTGLGDQGPLAAKLSRWTLDAGNQDFVAPKIRTRRQVSPTTRAGASQRPESAACPGFSRAM